MNAIEGDANLLPGAILHPGVNLHQGANCAYKRGLRLGCSKGQYVPQGPLGTKNRSRANCVPIYGDLY